MDHGEPKAATRIAARREIALETGDFIADGTERVAALAVETAKSFIARRQGSAFAKM